MIKKERHSPETFGTSDREDVNWSARFGKKKESSNDLEEIEELSTMPLTEDDDTEFLIHRGKQWLKVFMKMEMPVKTRSKWTNELLLVEFRDENAGICVLEIDRSGEEIKPLYYRSHSYGKNMLGAEEEE